MRHEISRRQFLSLSVVGLLGGIGALAGGGVYVKAVEPRWLQLVRIDVPIRDLPPSLNGLTIAQLSDLHVGPHAGPQQVHRAVEMVNGLAPDLVVLTGDYVLGGAAYGDACADALRGLRAPLGVHGTIGNHDVWEGAEVVSSALARGGVNMLRDRVQPIERGGARLWLIGLDDAGFTGLTSVLMLNSAVSQPGLSAVGRGLAASSRQERFFGRWRGARETLSRLLVDIPSGEPRLLLVHNPDFCEMLGDDRIDLALSGHTHGGQVRLPIIGAPLLPSCFGQKYTAGLVRVGATQVYVNRGIGLITPAVRLNCRPEVTLLRLRRAETGADPESNSSR